jgi:hypothetical protein
MVGGGHRERGDLRNAACRKVLHVGGVPGHFYLFTVTMAEAPWLPAAS